MKILWVSSLAWNDNGHFLYPVNGSGAVSGSLFEQSIIEGLEENGCDITIVNSYPYLTRENSQGFQWSHKANCVDFCVGSRRNKLFNLLYEKKDFIRVLKQIEIDQYDAVIGYLIHTPFLYAIKYLKKHNKNLQTLLICPDLSNMMDLGGNLLKRFAKKIECLVQKNLYKYIDKYVLFSKYMGEKLPVKNIRSIVVEGVNSIKDNTLSERDTDKFIIMYAGSLQMNFGLENLVEAFKMINQQNLELHIYGNGFLEGFFKKQALVDSRIKYFGFVNHEKVLSAERNANLLINVRSPFELFTRYSFPSKTFEYMMSGTPFLTTKLAGIPEEYYDFLFTIDNNEVMSIKKGIIDVLNESSGNIQNKVISGIEFLKNNKNKIVQSKKIKDFIEEH